MVILSSAHLSYAWLISIFIFFWFGLFLPIFSFVSYCPLFSFSSPFLIQSFPFTFFSLLSLHIQPNLSLSIKHLSPHFSVSLGLPSLLMLIYLTFHSYISCISPVFCLFLYHMSLSGGVVIIFQLKLLFTYYYRFGIRTFKA